MREPLSAYRDAEDLIELGAYAAGSNSLLDTSIRLRPELLDSFGQDHTGTASVQDTMVESRTWDYA